MWKLEQKMSVGSFSSPTSISSLLSLSIELRGKVGGGGVRLCFVLCAPFSLCGFCFESCVSVFSFVLIFLVLRFYFGSFDSVLSFVTLFWVFRFCFGVLWFCFEFCDFVLSFFILFWVCVYVLSLSATVQNSQTHAMLFKAMFCYVTSWFIN